MENTLFRGLQLFGEGAAPVGEGAAHEAAPQAAPEEAPREQAQDPELRRQELARRQMDLWESQAQAARQLYPRLDLNAEARDPRFRQLLGAGVEVGDAYLVLHKDEILPAAMRRAAQEVERRLTGRLMAGDVRPPENGIGPQSTAVTRTAVSQLTRADREDIRRRAARGEKIRF